MTPKQTCAISQHKLMRRVSPASAPPQQLMLVMLSKKHKRNAGLLCNPSDNASRGVPTQDTLVRTPLLLTMIKAFLIRNGLHNPKLEYGHASGQLALSPQLLVCPPPSEATI
ncbi:hypothetical protein O181_033225 [Austropuccinia psidii MF-1]|uniref:Uncharacterized protein n=1 Tax=Austropuccinia psidii MF-1 TaxID=1389203 RepID=A0A9Q3H908_9BASI|nr:hypothetical protein [Austropuccinia psidii MF-1]